MNKQQISTLENRFSKAVVAENAGRLTRARAAADIVKAEAHKAAGYDKDVDYLTALAIKAGGQYTKMDKSTDTAVAHFLTWDKAHKAAEIEKAAFKGFTYSQLLEISRAADTDEKRAAWLSDNDITPATSVRAMRDKRGEKDGEKPEDGKATPAAVTGLRKATPAEEARAAYIRIMTELRAALPAEKQSLAADLHKAVLALGANVPKNLKAHADVEAGKASRAAVKKDKPAAEKPAKDAPAEKKTA